MPSSLKSWRALCALAVLASACVVAAAQSYPNRPIKIVVGYPPGGATDIGARLVAQKLTASLGQPVLVDNRAGAGGNIAAEYVARAAPDGYTIFWITSSTAISASWYAKPGFNIYKDYAPISQVTSMAHLVVVHPSLPVSSIKDLVALAKSQPGKLDYSTSGAGGSPHLAGEWFKIMTGTELVHVAYKGTNPQLTDLLGGTVKIAFPTMPLMPDFVKQGKLKALAVTTATRSPLLPNVPTMVELGYPDFVVTAWHGMAFPAGTPKDIVNRVSVEVRRILDMPDVKETLTTSGFSAVSSTPEEFGAFIDAETHKWAKVIKDANLSTE